MDLKIVNTGNTTNISTISTTVSTTTPSNITRTVSFKIIWKELDSTMFFIYVFFINRKYKMNDPSIQKRLECDVDMLFVQLTKILDKFGYGWKFTLEDILGMGLSLNDMGEELYTLVIEMEGLSMCPEKWSEPPCDRPDSPI